MQLEFGIHDASQSLKIGLLCTALPCRTPFLFTYSIFGCSWAEPKKSHKLRGKINGKYITTRSAKTIQSSNHFRRI